MSIEDQTQQDTPGVERRPLLVGVLREQEPNERRVALVPDAVGRLAPLGVEVLVERGAGTRAFFLDGAYEAAGARLCGRDELVGEAAVVLAVGEPSSEDLGLLRPGQTLIAMIRSRTSLELVRELAKREVTAISFDGLPRTLSRAQSMDALTSQANVAGYKSVLVAADAFGRYFPLLITAAGTAKPANVLVLGAGVAGLQAMGTARRLGAVVTGYDVRPETRTEIESVGARFLELTSVGPASGEGGYARALSEEEQAAQQAELNTRIARFDIVITTAQVPGRRPPLLGTTEALAAMAPGSVVVDLAASELGGNVEGSVPNESVTSESGVTVIGATNLAAQVPAAASAAFSHNVTALLRDLVRGGAVTIDLDDELHAGVVVTRGGAVVHPLVAKLLDEAAPSKGA